MTHDNDLIRRGDAMDMCHGYWRDTRTRIMSIPAVAASQTSDTVINADSRQRVMVKPLVWEPVGNPNGRYRLHSTIAWARNTCPYGPYFIGLSSSCKNGEYSWDGPANTGKRGFADPESAKAAAQADYAARILAAIEPQPDPRDDVIARLVDALSMAQLWLDYAGAYDMQGINAALATAKAVTHEEN